MEKERSDWFIFRIYLLVKKILLNYSKMIKSTKEHNVIASFAHGLLMLNFYNSRKYKVIDCRLR